MISADLARLREAILADPLDPTCRSVLADALSEAGKDKEEQTQRDIAYCLAWDDFHLFLNGYIQRAIHAVVSTVGREYGRKDLATDTLHKMVEDCAAFWMEWSDCLEHNPKEAGLAFWLASSRHHLCFHRGFPEWKALSDAAHVYPCQNLYRSRDGLLHIHLG